MSKKKPTVSVWINPLAFLEVDEPWASMKEARLDFKSVIEFLCIPGTRCDLDGLVNRYRRISVEDPRFALPPAHEKILTKLVWPLRSAKGSYMLGNYLATVALCGFAAEMAAILLFEISEISLAGKSLTDRRQKRIFGSKFEKLGQHRRVEILHELELIGDNIEKDYTLVRKTRRKYLHFLSQDEKRIEQDAIDAYLSSVRIAVDTIVQESENGDLIYRSKILRFLEREGTISSE